MGEVISVITIRAPSLYIERVLLACFEVRVCFNPKRGLVLDEPKFDFLA
jgi:hypothetical protein